MKENSDLFDWAAEHNQAPDNSQDHVPSNPVSTELSESKDDGLGWLCPQCELLGRNCDRHAIEESSFQTSAFSPESSDKKNSDLTQEDIESSNRIADHETEIKRLESEMDRPLTQEEIDRVFEEMYGDFRKAS